MAQLTDREQAYFGPRTEKQPGSVAWCWQTILLMQERWKQKTLDEARFQEMVNELKTYRAWEVVPTHKPYGSLDALLLAEIGHTECGAKRQLIAQATGSTCKGGRPVRTETADLVVSTQLERARENGIGRDSQRKLDYLAGHNPSLLQEVQMGRIAIDKAYKIARGIKAETPLATLHRIWRQVSPDDRIRFLIEMLTPNERRALFLGFEEAEP
jgi:hypothetical protein